MSVVVQSWLVGDITKVGDVHSESNGPAWSSGLYFALDHWIYFDSHIMEFYDFNLQDNVVSNLGALIGLLTKYIEDNSCLLYTSDAADE